MSAIKSLCAIALATALAPLQVLAAGKLIVSGDDWTLTTGSPGAAPLAQNIAGQFGGTNFLLVDDNPYLPFSAYAYVTQTLQARGSVEFSPGFDAAALARSDTVFLFGTPGGYSGADRDALEVYLLEGGNVFIQLGTGLYGSGAGEADYWNVLFEKFGLRAERYHGPGGWNSPRIDQDSSPLAAGVPTVLWANGNYLSAIAGREAEVSIVLAEFSEIPGIVGVIAMAPAMVPEPASALLLLVGVIAVGLRAGRRCTAGRALIGPASIEHRPPTRMNPSTAPRSLPRLLRKLLHRRRAWASQRSSRSALNPLCRATPEDLAADR